MSFHLFVFGYISHFSCTEFTYCKKRKKYPVKTSTAHKFARGKLRDSILLELELRDL